jgi:hypothetical protein
MLKPHKTYEVFLFLKMEEIAINKLAKSRINLLGNFFWSLFPF